MTAFEVLVIDMQGREWLKQARGSGAAETAICSKQPPIFSLRID